MLESRSLFFENSDGLDSVKNFAFTKTCVRRRAISRRPVCDHSSLFPSLIVCFSRYLGKVKSHFVESGAFDRAIEFRDKVRSSLVEYGPLLFGTDLFNLVRNKTSLATAEKLRQEQERKTLHSAFRLIDEQFEAV